MLVGEVWLPDAERFARYLRPDELHTAFNFDFLACPWEPGPMRASIKSALASHAPVDAPATWVLSNHDVTRPVTRYGRADTRFAFETKREGTPDRPRPRHAAGPRGGAAGDGAARVDVHLPGRGARPAGGREHPARPAPGPDVAPLRRGRPGPRRLPGAAAVVGRRTAVRLQPERGKRRCGSTSREDWAPLTVEAESEDPASMLSLYREGLRIRRQAPWGENAAFSWLDYGDDVIAFARGERFICIVNFGSEPVELPAGPTSLSGAPS